MSVVKNLLKFMRDGHLEMNKEIVNVKVDKN